MKRELLSLTVVAMAFVFPVTLRAADPLLEQATALAAIERLGGEIKFDEEDPARPPIEVQFTEAQSRLLNRLSGNDAVAITDDALALLRQLPTVKKLTLACRQITDAGLAHLSELTQLEVLELGGLEFTGTLNGMPDYRNYRHVVPKVTDAGLEYLKPLTKLRELQLSYLTITDDGLRHLAGMRQLEVLTLDKTDISDAGLEHLKDLRALRELDLTGTRISGSGLACLRGMPHLHCLDLSQTPLTDDGLAFLDDLPALDWLVLAETQITDAGLQHIAQFAKMKVLYLDGLPITDAGLAHLAGMKDLNELYLHNTRITDAGLAHLAGMDNLGALGLQDKPITDAALPTIQGLRKLTCLGLAGTKVTDAAQQPLIEMTNLGWLDLGNTKITADCADDIQQAMPACHVSLCPPEEATLDDAAPMWIDDDKEPELDFHADPQAVLRMLSTDRDPAVRRRAALAIGDTAELSPEARDALANAVRTDRDESVRAAALDAFVTEAGEVRATFDLLVEALHDLSPRVRVRAAGLIEIGLRVYEETQPPKWPDVPAIVAAWRNPDPVVRGLLSLATRTYTADRQAALPVVLAALAQDDAAPLHKGTTNRRTNRFEAIVLAYIGEFGSEVAPAVSMLLRRLPTMPEPGDRDWYVGAADESVSSTLQALVRIGPRGVSQLLAAVESMHGTPRTVAAMALAELGQHRDKAIPPLIRSLHRGGGDYFSYGPSDRLDVRVLAHCGHEAVPALLKVGNGLPMSNMSLPEEAMNLMKDDAERVVPLLVAALDDPDASVRQSAASVLGTYEDLAEPAVPALRRATQDADDYIATTATRALRDIYDDRIKFDDDLRLLAGLDKLDFLSLRDTAIVGPGLAHLAGLRKLTTLTLPPTFDDSGTPHLAAFVRLSDLSLDKTEITDAGLANLRGLAFLTSLDLQGTQITDAGLQNLAGLTNLETLNLQGAAGVSDAGLAHLKRLVNLKSLDLRGTQVTNAGLKSLADMPRLNEIHLSEQITDAGLAELEKHVNLTTVNCGDSQVTPAGVARLHEKLPRCDVWPPANKQSPE